MLGGVRFGDYEDLVSGTREAKFLKGYMSCLMPMVLQTLKGIPDDERIELVFEQQNEYEPFVNLALQFFSVPEPEAPWIFTRDGQPKLARWGFVPKGSTLRTDPADYLAFALREAWTDKESKKAQWCKPILASGKGEGFGVIVKREKIREVISQTYMLALFDRMDRQFAAFCRRASSPASL
jgi:hypothetical protein